MVYKQLTNKPQPSIQVNRIVFAGILAVTSLNLLVFLVLKAKTANEVLDHLAKDPIIRGTILDPFITCLLIASFLRSLLVFIRLYIFGEPFLRRILDNRNNKNNNSFTKWLKVIGVVCLCSSLLIMARNMSLLLRMPHVGGKVEVNQQSLALMQTYEDEFLGTYIVVSRKDGRYNQISLPAMAFCEASLGVLEESTIVIACKHQLQHVPSYKITVNGSIMKIQEDGREGIIDLSTCPVWSPVTNTCIFGRFSY